MSDDAEHRKRRRSSLIQLKDAGAENILQPYPDHGERWVNNKKNPTLAAELNHENGGNSKHRQGVPTTTNRNKQRKRNPVNNNGKDKNNNNKVGDDDAPATEPLPFGNCIHASERYEKLGRLGQGTYGVVYKARDRITQRFVALKRCIPHAESSDGFPVTSLREIESLRVCSAHRHIVRLEDMAVSRSAVFLVLEYCEHDLSHLLDTHYSKHSNSPFSQAAVKTLMRQLLDAMQFVHAHSILHRDLKLSNLLYTNNGCLKVADFGLSRSYARHSSIVLTQTVASLWYRPPELLFPTMWNTASNTGSITATNSSNKNKGPNLYVAYTQAIDLWAVGCIFAELLRGVPLLQGTDELDQMDRMLDCMGLPRSDDFPALPPAWLDHITIDATRRWQKSRQEQRDQHASSSSPSSFRLPHSSSHHRSSYMRLLDWFGRVLSSEGWQLLTGLVHYSPNKRWTAEQALVCPYFQQDPLPLVESHMPRFPVSAPQMPLS